MDTSLIVGEFYLPKIPKFIRRIEDDFPVPLGELSGEEIEAICKEWRNQLYKLAEIQERKGTTFAHLPPRKGKANDW
jgi:hypothetical protein